MLKCHKCKEIFEDKHITTLTCPVCGSSQIEVLKPHKEA